MKGIIGPSILAAFLLPLAAEPQPAPRIHGVPAFRVLQVAADSILLEVGPWGHATPRSAVRAYRVSVNRVQRWFVADTVPATQTVDSLWVRRDTVDAEVQVCVNALTEGEPGPANCKPFTVPASTVVTAPGDFSIRILSAIGILPDSITLVLSDTLIPKIKTALWDADSIFALPIQWLGAVPMVCGTDDAKGRGWVQVEPDAAAIPYGWGPAAGGVFIPDAGCGWTMYAEDPEIATVKPAASL